MYQIGYHDALNKNKTNVDDFFSRKSMNKLKDYFEKGCSANPNLNIFDLMRKGISNNFDVSKFPKPKLRKIDSFFINVDDDFDDNKFRICIIKNMKNKAITLLEGFYDKLEP